MKLSLRYKGYNYVLTKDSSYAKRSGHMQTFRDIPSIVGLLTDIIKEPKNRIALHTHSFDLVKAHKIDKRLDSQYLLNIACKVLAKHIFVLKSPIDTGLDMGEATDLDGKGKDVNRAPGRLSQVKADRKYDPPTHPQYRPNHAIRTPPELARPFFLEFDALPAEYFDSKRSCWIEIVLQDEEGNSVKDEKYELYCDRQKISSGRTDENGKAKVLCLKQSQYEVCFPDIHQKEIWR